MIKPLNFNPYSPGQGSIIVNCQGLTIRVTNLLGQAFIYPSPNNPYHAMDQLLEKGTKTDLHLVDFHAETTAEKIAFASNYDGQITALVGTHTHVQTNDNRLLPKQTAFISDVGMTGILDSSIGLKLPHVIHKMKTNLPDLPFFRVATEGRKVLSAVIIKVNNKTKQASSIEKIYIVDN